jgi:hypothetical protein
MVLVAIKARDFKRLVVTVCKKVVTRVEGPTSPKLGMHAEGNASDEEPNISAWRESLNDEGAGIFPMHFALNMVGWAVSPAA